MSWNDDNTVPINDFSQQSETSLNVGLEDDDIEDFIPTSQPRSGESLSLEQPFANRKIEETIPGEEEFSTIEDTLPVSRNDTFSDSCDYIPDTETKLKRQHDDIPEMNEPACKKSLDVPNSAEVRFSEDIFSTQMSKVPASPTVIDSQLLSVINETETSNLFLPNEESDADMSKDILVSDASVTEIFDNDLSRETITLDSRKTSKILETQELSSDTNKNENEIIDIDSPLRFMETSSSLPVFTSQQVEEELPQSQEKRSEDAMTNDTIDANGVDFPPLSPFPKRCDTNLSTICKIPSLSNGSSSSGEIEKLTKKSSSSALRKNVLTALSGEAVEVQKHSTPENHSSKIFNTDESASSIENLTPLPDGTNKKIELTFYLKIDCEVTFDSEYKEIISKRIIDAVDFDKSKLAKRFVEPFYGTSSDDKSKRLSSSSSGSVYSDKTGFPFALPRLSAATRQTESSGSNDEFDKAFKARSRKLWENEYKLPMKMDEIFERRLPKIREMDDMNDSAKRKTPLSSKKPKSRRRVPQKILSDVTESTNTEDFLSNSGMNLSDGSSGLMDKEKNSTQKSDMNLSEQSNKGKNSVQNSDSDIQEPEKKDESTYNRSDDKSLEKVTEVESADEEDEEEEKDSREENPKEDGPENKALEKEAEDSESEAASDLESDSDELKIGTAVFARWTDLNYYSGILYEQTKVDRWNVKFDDGSMKVIREDFILPLRWIKEGELVFASINNEYESGKIVKVDRKKLKEFTVELDETNLEVSVNRIDIRLTETMATIVKEKYQPLNNVLSGKRNRELTTPTRAAVIQTGSSRKKNSATKSAEPKTPARSSTKKSETPVAVRSTGRGRKPKISDQSESSPIVQDTKTPTRQPKPKGKAKSLNQEFEQSATTAATTPLPTVPEEPVPGPSNVKRGRGRPKLASFEPPKDEASSKKTESKQSNEDKEEDNAPTETRRGKRKLKTAEVPESKSEEESTTAKKKGRGSKKSK